MIKLLDPTNLQKIQRMQEHGKLHIKNTINKIQTLGSGRTNDPISSNKCRERESTDQKTLKRPINLCGKLIWILIQTNFKTKMTIMR